MTEATLAPLAMIRSVSVPELPLVLLQLRALLIHSTKPSSLAIAALDTCRTPTSLALILMSAQLELSSAQTVPTHLLLIVSTLMVVLLAVLTLIRTEFALQELPEQLHVS